MKRIVLMLFFVSFFSVTFNTSFAATTKCPGESVSVTWTSSSCPNDAPSVSYGGSCGFSGGIFSKSGTKVVGVAPSSGSCTATMSCTGATPSTDTLNVVNGPSCCGIGSQVGLTYWNSNTNTCTTPPAQQPVNCTNPLATNYNMNNGQCSSCKYGGTLPNNCNSAPVTTGSCAGTVNWGPGACSAYVTMTVGQPSQTVYSSASNWTGSAVVNCGAPGAPALAYTNSCTYNPPVQICYTPNDANYLTGACTNTCKNGVSPSYYPNCVAPVQTPCSGTVTWGGGCSANTSGIPYNTTNYYITANIGVGAAYVICPVAGSLPTVSQNLGCTPPVVAKQGNIYANPTSCIGPSCNTQLSWTSSGLASPNTYDSFSSVGWGAATSPITVTLNGFGVHKIWIRDGNTNINSVDVTVLAPVTYSCLNLPANANWFAPPDNTGLTANTNYTYSSIGDTATKCQYNCVGSSAWTGSSCVTCNGAGCTNNNCNNGGTPPYGCFPASCPNGAIPSTNCTQCANGGDPAYNCSLCKDGQYGSGCSQTCNSAGGSPGCTGHVPVGAGPAGLSCNNNTNNPPSCSICSNGATPSSNCTQCTYGHYGSGCSQTCGGTGCSGYGTPYGQGSLTCNNGAYPFPACDQCPTGTYGPSCSQTCGHEGCNGHGTIYGPSGLSCKNGSSEVPSCNIYGCISPTVIVKGVARPSNNQTGPPPAGPANTGTLCCAGWTEPATTPGTPPNRPPVTDVCKPKDPVISSFSTQPRTSSAGAVTGGASTVLSWNIKYPTVSCSITATAVCVGGSSSCSQTEKNDVATLNTQIQAKIPDMNSAIKTAFDNSMNAGAPNNVTGSMSLKIKHTTDLILQCGSVTSKTRFLVTTNNEG